MDGIKSKKTRMKEEENSKKGNIRKEMLEKGLEKNGIKEQRDRMEEGEN